MAETLDSGNFNSGSKVMMQNDEAVCSNKKPGQEMSEIEPGSTNWSRAEIDTSAPFESVKEATNFFGGIGFWRPNYPHKLSGAELHDMEDVDPGKLEEQAAQLEKDLVAKEMETLDALKELETAKIAVEELKSKLQKQEAEKENHEHLDLEHINTSGGGLSMFPSSSPGLILLQLKQAKLNLNRTTSDLSDIRASVASFNKKIEEERASLENTRKRLSSNSSKISSLEGELSQTRKKLQLAQESEIKVGSDDPAELSKELQKLSYEAEQFKKMGEEAKCEVMRAMCEIEQTKSRIQAAELRLVASKKMKEASRMAESIALADIKVSSKENLQDHERITLSFEEYASLTSKAREAEELSKHRINEAMRQVNEANQSKMDIMKKVEEATSEVKASKKVLEEALRRVEAANREKLSVEQSLRKWRSERGRKRRSVQNSSKFKNNSHLSQNRKDSVLVDVNGLNLVNKDSMPVLRPTLSIGQILSRKLLMPEGIESEEISPVKEKVSLGQMLNKQNGDAEIPNKDEKENGDEQIPMKDEKENDPKFVSAKRKKFGFARFSLLLAKQSKKKKKIPSSILRSCSSGLQII